MMSVQSPAQPADLFNWKRPPLSTPNPPRIAVRVVSKVAEPKSRFAPHVLIETRRASSVPQLSDTASEGSLKRKKSPDSRSSTPASDSPLKRQNTKGSSSGSSKKSSSRATPTPSGSNGHRSRSARLPSRRRSNEPADSVYTPPPKRVRSHFPFGSLERPVERTCANLLDGKVNQYSAKDVVQSLLPTYTAYFKNPRDDSDKSWEIIDGKYPCVELEYPNNGARETFPLLVPKDPQHYNPLMELTESLETIIQHFVPREHQSAFGTISSNMLSSQVNGASTPAHATMTPTGSPSSDLLQSMRNAEHRHDGPLFVHCIGEVNRLLLAIKAGENPTQSTGITRSNTPVPYPPVAHEQSSNHDSLSPVSSTQNPMREITKTWRGVPVPIWKTILGETYQRCIGPSIGMLKEYTPHSSETYGELEAAFVSDILHQCGVTPSTKFVDLGSGVGNVVLQLSLQAGCDAYGIELRPKLHELAKAQRDELEKRCRMWAVTCSNIELEQGDFRESARTKRVLKDADVVLVNNFKFGPDLNASLANMFLDMHEGAIVVTLNPLLPENFRISIHTMYNPLAIFEQEEREYHRGSVSWSNVGGKYFIHRINRASLVKFEEQNQQMIMDAARKSNYKYQHSTQKRGKA